MHRTALWSWVNMHVDAGGDEYYFDIPTRKWLKAYIKDLGYGNLRAICFVLSVGRQ